MKKLILHIGPGKCGSSSIQTFFRINKKPCTQKVKFIYLDPQYINKLNQTDFEEDALKYFTKLLDKNTRFLDTIILSHEYLFQCPQTIKNICNISEGKVSEIIIIGYSRRQSDFFVSSYSQWLFKSSERISEVKEVMIEMGLNPIYFSGIERQLIASIVNDFYSARQLSNVSIFDWNNSYAKIDKLISDTDVKIKCGALPDKNSTKNLIEDFCDKAGLTLRDEVKESTNLRENARLNNHFIESVNNAINQGIDISGLQNKHFVEISKKMNSINEDEDSFFLTLKQYIDSYFLTSNIEFCKKYGINKNYFESINQYSKTEILKIIKDEEQKKGKDNTSLKKYKELSSILMESCFSIIRDSDKYF